MFRSSFTLQYMLAMFYRQENPGVTCAKNLRKGTRPKIREILSPHLLSLILYESKRTLDSFICICDGQDDYEVL
jgi:hypothetical protein